MTDKLTMPLPDGFATTLSRRHNGREDITNDQILEGRIQMEWLWGEYKKTTAALDYCEGAWWDEMKIEASQFRNPRRWQYGHSKRKKLMAKQKDLHRQIFNLLVRTDGNYEPFGGDAMSAEDCYLDFMGKYPLPIKPL